MKESGADPRLLLTLGEALRNLGQLEQAAQFFDHAIHRATAGSSEMLEAYYGRLTTLGDGSASSLQSQIATCLEALETYPLDAQLLCAMGGFLVQQGNLPLGVRSFEMALAFGQVNPQVMHLVDVRPLAAMCAATALVTLGEPSKAKSLLQKALSDAPDHAALRTRLGELEAEMAAA